MQIAATDSRPETEVTVTLRSDAPVTTLNSPVEFYPFDLVAAQREFQASPRLAKQFEDYLLRRMHGVTPVKGPTDEHGRARANLREGNWWLRATASSGNGEHCHLRRTSPPVVNQDPDGTARCRARPIRSWFEAIERPDIQRRAERVSRLAEYEGGPLA